MQVLVETVTKLKPLSTTNTRIVMHYVKVSGRPKCVGYIILEIGLIFIYLNCLLKYRHYRSPIFLSITFLYTHHRKLKYTDKPYSLTVVKNSETNENLLLPNWKTLENPVHIRLHRTNKLDQASSLRDRHTILVLGQAYAKNTVK